MIVSLLAHLMKWRHLFASFTRRNIGLACFAFLPLVLFSQSDSASQQVGPPEEKKKVSMRDTLDGKLDLSSFLLDMHGFIPVPFIITEPALGGFGAAVAPVFLSPKKNVPKGMGYVAPDITAGFGMYTANGSWAAGGGRMGSIPKAGIKYRAFAAYADINISFYRELENKVEKEMAFNFESIPVLVSVSKRITRQQVYLGAQYFFAKNKLSPRFEGDLPGSIDPKQFDSKIASFGVFLDWDRRDNVFTADKGGYTNLLYNINDSWTGSDFTYQRLSWFLHYYLPLKRNWISAFRFETNKAFNEPPFYALPSINLRGVPAVRYQGYTTVLFETEQRYDFNRRWSGVAFGGFGKAMQRGQSFGEGQSVYNFGGGFRYLISRVFRVRTGIDIARGLIAGVGTSCLVMPGIADSISSHFTFFHLPQCG